MRPKKPRVGVGDRIVFPRGYAAWKFVRQPSGEVVDPYGSVSYDIIGGQVDIPVGTVATVVEEARLLNLLEERVLRVKLLGNDVPDLLLSPGRDSFSYRRVAP